MARAYRAARGAAATAGAWMAAVCVAAAQEPGNAVVGETVGDMFRRGGILMWPILICSVVAFAFVLERWVSLRRSAIFPGKLFDEVRGMAREGRLQAAVDRSGESGTPFGRLVYACLSRADAPGFEMEAALEEVGSRILYDLRKNGRPLGVIADVTPLLGLMGTVLGMIKAFDVVARTGALGRAELLAEGIAEALLTTAFGLSVAIPALILDQYFRGRADDLLRNMEDACMTVMDEYRNSRKAA